MLQIQSHIHLSYRNLIHIIEVMLQIHTVKEKKLKSENFSVKKMTDD